MKDKDHTVSYRPLEYYSMSESSKRHIKKCKIKAFQLNMMPKENQKTLARWNLSL